MSDREEEEAGEEASLLRWLATMVERGEGGLPMTFLIGGQWITGTVVPSAAFLNDLVDKTTVGIEDSKERIELVSAMRAALGLTSSPPLDTSDPGTWPRVLHLEDVRFLTPNATGGTRLEWIEGLRLRVMTEAIQGYALGNLDTRSSS